jgi:hypothetical protein
VSAKLSIYGDCEGCEGTGYLVGTEAAPNCRLCRGTGTRVEPRVGEGSDKKTLELRVAHGAYGVLRFHVGDRDALLVLPHNLTEAERRSAQLELEAILEVVRTLPTPRG